MLTFLPGCDTVTHILLYLLAFFTLIQLVYIWVIWGRFAFHRRKAPPDAMQPVSVVISAKNEYYNLNRNLPLILEQDYPDFEVVVVNDASDDDSAELLEDMTRRYERLKVVTIRENLNFFSGKKFPLSIGIKSAKNEILLLTDADCKPSGPYWIRNMQRHFGGKNIRIVLGYGRYEKRKGLLNMLIRYETLWTAMQYFSMSLLGSPYMGVGRNLAYRKSFFYEKKGFTSHYRIVSGDDDLFVNQNAETGNVAIEFQADTQTISPPKITFSSWFNQKKRHLSTGRHYRLRHRMALGFYHFTLLVFYGLAVFLWAGMNEYIYASALFALRFFSLYPVIKKSMNKLGERNLLLLSPLLEIFLMLFLPFTFLSVLLNPVHRWK